MLHGLPCRRHAWRPERWRKQWRPKQSGSHLGLLVFLWLGARPRTVRISVFLKTLPLASVLALWRAVWFRMFWRETSKLRDVCLLVQLQMGVLAANDLRLWQPPNPSEAAAASLKSLRLAGSVSDPSLPSRKNTGTRGTELGAAGWEGVQAQVMQ